VGIRDMLDNHPYDIEDAVCIRETEKAILIEAPQFDSAVWIPITQIHMDSEVTEKGDEGTLRVYMWLARERGWTDY